MRLLDQITPGVRAWATNANTSSFASKIPTTTAPVNDGVVRLPAGGAVLAPQRVKLWPIGLGANNDAFSMRLWGWTLCGTLWLPSILCEVACTMGNVTGVAGATVLDTEFFCDTITIVSARQRVFTDTDSGGAASRGTVEILSPTNDTPGYLIVPLIGVDRWEPIFDQTTNSPTMNVLYSYL